MAQEHPLKYGILNFIPIRLDLKVWCGATFIYEFMREYHETDLMYNEASYHKFKDLDRIAENYDQQNSRTPASYVDVADKILMNIRKKTNSWSKLGPVIWSTEFLPYREALPGRPLTLDDLYKIRIEIPAAFTAELLDNKYTYELITITTSIEDGTMPLTTKNTYRELTAFGDILPHQVGEL